MPPPPTMFSDIAVKDEPVDEELADAAIIVAAEAEELHHLETALSHQGEEDVAAQRDVVLHDLPPPPPGGHPLAEESRMEEPTGTVEDPLARRVDHGNDPEQAALDAGEEAAAAAMEA